MSRCSVVGVRIPPNGANDERKKTISAMEYKFESAVKEIAYSQQAVYDRLSDLSNVEHIRGLLPEDKVSELCYDSDSVSASVAPVGNVTLRIIEREEPKCVKFAAERSPLPFNMWIQIVPVGDVSCKIKLTIKAELNPFIKGMVSRPLQEGLDKVAEALAAAKYEQ